MKLSGFSITRSKVARSAQDKGANLMSVTRGLFAGHLYVLPIGRKLTTHVVIVAYVCVCVCV